MSYRQLILFAGPAIEYKNVNDAGAGTDSITIQGQPSLIDSGSGADAISIEGQASVSDQGQGQDSVLAQGNVAPSDQGQGIDSIEAKGYADISETGSGQESMTIEGRGQISDTGQGTDQVSAAAQVELQDQGAGIDGIAAGPLVEIHDEGIGIDIAYRVQGEISIDGVDLPHVLNISVEEPSIVQDLPVMDALPYRKQLGKRGRSLKIQGWTDSLSTLETLRAYADGDEHVLILPTGDGMKAHVIDVRTPEDVEKYHIYDYQMEALEVVD